MNLQIVSCAFRRNSYDKILIIPQNRITTVTSSLPRHHLWCSFVAAARAAGWRTDPSRFSPHNPMLTRPAVLTDCLRFSALSVIAPRQRGAGLVRTEWNGCILPTGALIRSHPSDSTKKIARCRCAGKIFIVFLHPKNYLIINKNTKYYEQHIYPNSHSCGFCR